MSQAKPFWFPYASHIASDNLRAAIRADLSSEKAIGAFKDLPPPFTLMAPDAPETTMEAPGFTTNSPERSRLRFRQFA